MSAAKRPSLVAELGVALALSSVAAALGLTLMLIFPAGTALRILIALCALAYLLYRLGMAGEKTGRITAIVLWGVATAAVSWLGLPLGAYLATQAAMLWLVRSLYGYSSLVAAGEDLALTALGLAFAVWAVVRTDSLFLATWCFFLIEALHVFIPASGYRQSGVDAPAAATDDAFANAHRAAQAALTRLARRN